jgi:hypothetical protein
VNWLTTRNASARLGHVPVHLAQLVGKDAQAGDLLRKPFGLRRRIAVSHAEEHQQARADLAGRFSADPHAGFGHALH